MAYQGYSDGIYLAAQPSRKGGFAHFLVLDIGNRLEVPGADGMNPVIVHQTPPGIQAELFQGEGVWLLAKATDDAAALQRYRAACTVPAYHFLRHNCEHFARFVVTGTWESKQLQGIGWLAGITALVIVAASNEAPPRRARAQPASRGGWQYASRRRSRAGVQRRVRLPG